MANSYNAVRKELAAPGLVGSALVGINSARLRRGMGLNIDELALRLGWTPEAVVALESANLVDLALDDIDVLAKTFGVLPGALFA
jgi:transcriptional regulator with XRE-family HTH domain